MALIEQESNINQPPVEFITPAFQEQLSEPKRLPTLLRNLIPLDALTQVLIDKTPFSGVEAADYLGRLNVPLVQVLEKRAQNLKNSEDTTGFQFSFINPSNEIIQVAVKMPLTPHGKVPEKVKKTLKALREYQQHPKKDRQQNIETAFFKAKEDPYSSQFDLRVWHSSLKELEQIKKLKEEINKDPNWKEANQALAGMSVPWLTAFLEKNPKIKKITKLVLAGLLAACSLRISTPEAVVTIPPTQEPAFTRPPIVPTETSLPRVNPVPQEWLYLYPFFQSKGDRACSEYSTNIADNGAGKVNEYWDPEAFGVKDNERKICYFVAYLKLYGVPEGAEIDFTPDWCPSKDCGGLQSEFRSLEGTPGYEEAPFAIGYPLPAEGGVLNINGREYRLNLKSGENVVSLAPPDHQKLLQARNIDVNKLWFIGQTVDVETNKVLTKEDTLIFKPQAEAIVNKLLGALNENVLSRKGLLWWTVGTDLNNEVVLTGQYYDQEGSLQALFYPDEENELQLLLSPEKGSKQVAMIYRKGKVYAFIGNEEIVREKNEWLAVSKAIGGAESPETPSKAEKDSVLDLPLYLPAVNEPIEYVAQRFGLTVSKITQVNPTLGKEVDPINGLRLPIQPVSVEELDLITIRNYGVTAYKVPTPEEIWAFLKQEGWEPTALTVDLIPVTWLLSDKVESLPKGWSFRQDPDHHRIIVYVSEKMDIHHLVHELCHEAKNTSDEDETWKCVFESVEKAKSRGE
ncbi:hypothetical protein COT75_03540 [Candidatus Beckwithbacteria bacterium CG10_big_fil_rev_8_21_14_0_10_34_10]|uniref:LysM domain-containing protein n=1 Tax=Candidatus Beckwithbacteria bacterium CG10_big_fil_rev_8_21_14_0_10_34_10 TaxID=1974495 RepID=A0A2H0W8S0_9BACT|nr:MAG: hypothetical protein COT75_03540 [Candidatus Beckwithbacteria bacterium CG10_big_fil_rev_8_21_14_0_10_34_10]